MKNKKCYIAGKIGELALEVYTEMFEKAEVEVRKLGFVPVSPLKLPHNHNKSWNEYMKEDLKALLDCGYLYTLRNWRLSPGACIEVELATKVGINIIHQ